jgi:hypothetical protein
MKTEGIKKNVIRKQIKFDNYVDTSNNESFEASKIAQALIVNIEQEIFTSKQEQTSLSWLYV